MRFNKITNFGLICITFFIILQYGNVTALVVSSAKKGRAMVEFENESTAVNANPLKQKQLNNNIYFYKYFCKKIV